MPTQFPISPGETCSRCLSPASRCICGGISPIDNRTALLILQHPREQGVPLGSARLAALHFKNAELRIGLSWPSLAAALGRPADPHHWAVLYLGSAKPATLAPEREIMVLDRRGRLVANQDGALSQIDGITILDGTWGQAKALWWRNPWMLKAKRVVLGPHRRSRYGELRREPRPEGLSSLEAAALLLARLEGKPEIMTILDASFERSLYRFRSVLEATRRGNTLGGRAKIRRLNRSGQR